MGTVSRAAQTKSSGKGLRYNQATPGKSGGVVEIRTSGHGSEEGKDSITFPGATLQPITALSQRVQVPPQQGSRQLRSDTRLRRGVTCGGESSGVKVSATAKGVGLVERRATLRAGAQAKAGDASKRGPVRKPGTGR